jgi:hypothetical protein
MTATTTSTAAALLSSIASTAPAINFTPQRPTAEMTVAELGLFASNAARKSAESAWELGRALMLAKEALKNPEKNPEKLKWLKWCEVYVPHLNPKTRERYMSLGKLDFDDVRSKNLTDVYKMMFGENYTKAKGKKTPAAVEPETDDDQGEPLVKDTTAFPTPDPMTDAIKTLVDAMNNPADLEPHRGELLKLYTALAAFLG